ncbi:cellulose binding domain-containing protein [Acidisoma sp. 7E03]
MAAITPALYHSDTSTTVTPATVDFLVKLSTASSSAVTVHYQTMDGTAKAGVDYVAASGTVTFAPGTTTAIVSTDLFGDSSATSALDFFLSLSDPVGASLLGEKATATLIPASVGSGASSGSTATGSSGSTSPDITVTPSLTQSWSGGFLENVTITNNSDQALSQWEVEMTSPAAVTNLWNAVTLSHSGSSYLLGNASYNGTIAAHSSVSFGFQAAGSSADPLTVVYHTS